ncbi:MAG: rhodanese-like domain-containing protein [Bacteroidota bacterium]
MKPYALCFVLLLFGLSCKKNTPAEIIIVDKEFLQEEVLGKDVQLVDVRTQEEYESGHIDDAINFNIINNELFLEQIETLEKDEPVYLYCKMGGRSNRAAQLLKDQGFTEIYDYSAGYNDWVLD